MADKNCGYFEGTLPEREIGWHLKDVPYNKVVDRLIAGSYIVDENICQFYQDGTIEVHVASNTDKHFFKVFIYSYKLREKSLNKMAQRIAEAFLKYEEDAYKKHASDTSWQQLRGKVKAPFKFLKGEMLDSYAQAIEEGAFWKEHLTYEVKSVTEKGIIGLDIKVHRDECSVEIITYIKDIERAYDNDSDIEFYLDLIAFYTAVAIRKWELSVCDNNTPEGVLAND